MNIRQLLQSITGYWIHKQDTLPIGTDLFYDLTKRIQNNNLDIIFDVGANVGQTYEWVRHYQQVSKLYCFEPVQSVFKVLQQKAGHDRNCVLENLALGDTPATKTIRLHDDFSVLNSLRDDLMNQNFKAKEELIIVDTLDAYCNKNNISRIDLLKIDTEGYEMQVLHGATNMLANAAVAFIYCEVGFLRANTRNTNLGDLCEFLAEKEYVFFGLYQVSHYDWKNGNSFGNALFVHSSYLKGF